MSSSEAEILNAFIKDVKSITKHIEFIDAMVKVSQKIEGRSISSILQDHIVDIQLLSASTEVLRQRLENHTVREHKGRKKVDSGYGDSANSTSMGAGGNTESGRLDSFNMASLPEEHPIQETGCPGPSENFDFSIKDDSDDDVPTCSEA